MIYQIGIPNSLRGKLKVRLTYDFFITIFLIEIFKCHPQIKVDVVQDCPRRRRKEESYTINLRLDDE